MAVGGMNLVQLYVSTFPDKCSSSSLNSCPASATVIPCQCDLALDDLFMYAFSGFHN